MIVNVEIKTNTKQTLHISLLVFKSELEDQESYVAYCFNMNTKEKEYFGEVQSLTLENVLINIRNFIYKFNPLSIEVSFKNFYKNEFTESDEEFSKDEIIYISSFLKKK